MNILACQAVTDEVFYSREGYQFRLSDDRWQLNKDVDIPIVAIGSFLTPEMFLSFRLVLAFYATTTSGAHVANCFYRSKAYLEATLGQLPFSVESLISYRSTLDKKNEWYMGTLRGFIRQWAAMGHLGISDDVIQLLGKWRIKGNEKGYAVQSMCPENGPLTDIEIQGVLEAVIAAFGKGNLPLTDTAYTLTVAMTGRRPTQITALKIKDLIKQSSNDGIDRFFINFPRAKQRLKGWRSEFSQFAICEDLWLVLQQQAKAVQQEFTERIGTRVPLNLIPELPLFLTPDRFDSSIDLKEQLATDCLHAASETLYSTLARVENIISLNSERTGQRIHLNPTRFRYTLGTNLAREGKGEYIIAEALDHTDTQNAGVYVKNIPDIVERIDKAVALQLAPIAQAFQGVLVASENDAVRGNDLGSRISNGSKNVGTCGSYGFCSALAPVACYTCNNFQPWLDGPHEDILDSLIRERNNILEQTNDLKIASINDRLILAVSDVVNRCKVMKELENG